jgi:hypothetical protein
VFEPPGGPNIIKFKKTGKWQPAQLFTKHRLKNTENIYKKTRLKTPAPFSAGVAQSWPNHGPIMKNHGPIIICFWVFF